MSLLLSFRLILYETRLGFDNQNKLLLFCAKRSLLNAKPQWEILVELQKGEASRLHHGG
jgi:hypothetical protein